MAADLGDLYARLKLDTTSLDAAGAKVGGLGAIFGGLTSPLNLAAGAVAAVGVGSLAMAANFQQATDRMAAQAGITQQQAQKIADAFLTTGGKTTFSAQQIVKAYGPVSGQLGLVEGHALNAAQAMKVMTAAMDLAEATGKPLSETTGALAQVMQAYGIHVAGAAKTSDLLFNVSRSLNIPVADLAGTVDKLHAKLGPLAPSLSDVSRLLVDVASHGLTGNRALLLVSTAATTLISNYDKVPAQLQKATDAFRTQSEGLAKAKETLDAHVDALQKLQASNKATPEALGNAQRAIDDEKQHIADLTEKLGADKSKVDELQQGLGGLGLQVFDASGKFVGMGSIIEQLAPKLATMTEQQRLATEQTLFGAGASHALDETIMAGLPGWDKAAKAADRLGTAHQGAQTATDNLKGALDRARSAVVDVLIGLGEKILPPVAAALGFISDHLSTILQVAGPLAVALAGLWAVQHIVNWGAKAIETIGKVVAALTASGGLQQLLSKLFPSLTSVGGGAGTAAADIAKGMRVWGGPVEVIGLDVGGGGAVPASLNVGREELSGLFAGLSVADLLGPAAIVALGIIGGLIVGPMLVNTQALTNKFDALIKPADDMLHDLQISAAATKTLDDAMGVNPAIALAMQGVATSSGFTNLWSVQQSKLMEDLAKAIKNGTVKTPQDVRDFATAWENASNQSGTRILPDTKAVADALANLKKRWTDAMNKIISSFESAANTSASQAPIWNTLFHSITANLGTAAQQAARIIHDLGPQPAPTGSHVGGGNPWGAYAGTGQFGLVVPPGQWGIAGEAGPEPVFGGRSGATIVPAGAPNITMHFTLNGGDEALVQRVQQVVSRSLNDVLLAARS